MRLLRLLPILSLLALMLSGCGGSSSDQWSDQELKDLSPWLMKLPTGRIVLAPAGTPNGIHLDPAGVPSESQSLVEDEDSPSHRQLIVTGIITHPDFQGGTLLVETRKTRNCDKGLCPDMDSLPVSSVILEEPGFFSLVVPQEGQALFVVAFYQKDDISEQKESYLGIVEKRVDGLHFDFGN